jgi:hypothetical protein
MAICCRTIIGAAVLVGATTLVTSQVISQDHQKQVQEMQEAQEMMAAWMKLAEPGPEHEGLARMAGTWHHASTYWMQPGAEPQTSTATAELEPILGGRFVLEKVRGVNEFMGEKHEFEGLGIFGYDRFKKKHIFAWLDNMGTLIMIGEGTADETGNVITYMSELPNPMSGGTMGIKTITRIETDDKHTVEMHQQLPDGSWFLHMTIEATRKG